MATSRCRRVRGTHEQRREATRSSRVKNGRQDANDGKGAGWRTIGLVVFVRCTRACACLCVRVRACVRAPSSVVGSWVHLEGTDLVARLLAWVAKAAGGRKAARRTEEGTSGSILGDLSGTQKLRASRHVVWACVEHIHIMCITCMTMSMLRRRDVVCVQTLLGDESFVAAVSTEMEEWHRHSRTRSLGELEEASGRYRFATGSRFSSSLSGYTQSESSAFCKNSQSSDGRRERQRGHGDDARG